MDGAAVEARIAAAVESPLQVPKNSVPPTTEESAAPGDEGDAVAGEMNEHANGATGGDAAAAEHAASAVVAEGATQVEGTLDNAPVVDHGADADESIGLEQGLLPVSGVDGDDRGATEAGGYDQEGGSPECAGTRRAEDAAGGPPVDDEARAAALPEERSQACYAEVRESSDEQSSGAVGPGPAAAVGEAVGGTAAEATNRAQGDAGGADRGGMIHDVHALSAAPSADNGQPGEANDTMSAPPSAGLVGDASGAPSNPVQGTANISGVGGELSSLGLRLNAIALDDELIISPRAADGALANFASGGGRGVVGLENGGSLALGSIFFCEERHLLSLFEPDEAQPGAGLVSKWRMKDRLKTVAVAIALCLNIGVDPPDVIRIPPCAKLQAWIDPFSMPPQKSLEQIGKKLQSQYERWQPRARFKTSLDPTFDDIRKLCGSCRRHAKGERVLFHYNGHGVPRPTANGELWVFNSSYTQYIPLSVYDLQSWLSAPAIYIFDCSSAGLILNSFCQFAEQRCQDEPDAGMNGAMGGHGGSRDASSGHVGGRRLLSDSIVLAACGAKERLPQDGSLPADIFTACLTTPIKAALWWFCERSLLRDEGITQELVDKIPGRQTDRKTPLGELNWIFTAITDTIAWNMLPRSLFQRLFRQDLLVASLFRNYLLAERVLQSVSCTPVSYPALPPTHQHRMWCAWDLAAEGCLAQLPALLAEGRSYGGPHGPESGQPAGNGAAPEYQVSPFFSQQLQAFEVWLEHGHPGKNPPEQLPIVLQVLLSQSHRLKALVLLGRFLDIGPWAVDLALSVGIFPYVLKLLQTTAVDLRQILIFIWAKILALDRKCQGTLVHPSCSRSRTIKSL